MTVLNRQVLLLNRNWQAIGVTDVQTALADVCRGQKRAIDTTDMSALAWDDWIKLSIREGDLLIKSVRGPVRIPTVIVSAYSGMPKKRPKKNRKGIGKRDGFRCAYTGVYCPEEGTLDHVLPRSRGGSEAWTNLVWSHKAVNHRKADRTPEEAGLKLRLVPKEPQPVAVCKLIQPLHRDWTHFLAG